MSTISVLDAVGAAQTIQAPNANGRAAAAASRPVALSTEDKASIDALAVANAEYETVAASQTDQVLGATGSAGDFLSHLLIVPGTTSPGAVTIKDGAGGAITVFTGGASSVTSLIPFCVPLNIKSLAGAWKVSTGANVSVIAVGDFT